MPAKVVNIKKGNMWGPFSAQPKPHIFDDHTSTAVSGIIILVWYSYQSANGYYVFGQSGIPYATDVKNLLFLVRLELLCKTGRVPHYFQYRRGNIHIFSPKPASNSSLVPRTVDSFI